MKLLIATTLALALAATSAHADPRAFTIGGQPSWFLLAGVTGGGTPYETHGGFVGGELSVTRLRQGRMLGVYADSYYDFGVDGTYLTGGLAVGRKIGMIPLGLDAGGAVRFAYGDRQLGATGRIFVSAGIFSIYARYLYFTDTDRNDHVVQLGAALKLPLVSPW
ncbi:MAG: hypothetical protein ABIY55_26735 [Kofleriaceae bacterium]